MKLFYINNQKNFSELLNHLESMGLQRGNANVDPESINSDYHNYVVKVDAGKYYLLEKSFAEPYAKHNGVKIKIFNPSPMINANDLLDKIGELSANNLDKFSIETCRVVDSIQEMILQMCV